MYEPYRKQRKALKIKRHKGTFSLSNQVVLNQRTKEVLAGVKVLGISIASGVRRGYIRYSEGNGLHTKRVREYGMEAWITLDILQEEEERSRNYA